MDIKTSDGRKLWLDRETDPHNVIGWVADNPPADIGVESDPLTVAEAMALAPDQRDKVVTETRDAITLQCEVAADPDSGYPPEHWAGWIRATGDLAGQLRDALED